MRRLTAAAIVPLVVVALQWTSSAASKQTFPTPSKKWGTSYLRQTALKSHEKRQVIRKIMSTLLHRSAELSADGKRLSGEGAWVGELEQMRLHLVGVWNNRNIGQSVSREYYTDRPGIKRALRKATTLFNALELEVVRRHGDATERTVLWGRRQEAAGLVSFLTRLYKNTDVLGAIEDSEHWLKIKTY